MQIGFNPAAYQPYTGIELLAAGDYPVMIEDVVAERAKDPASGLLKVTFVVAQGHPNAGRKLFYRLNLWNVSEESKATAHKQLTSLCYAVGITGQLNDTDELKGRQCIIGVTNDGTYNNVKLVKDMAGNEPGKAPVSQGAPAQGGMPQFNLPPQGAMPAGFNPGQQQQPASAPPVQYQQPMQQPPAQAGNPFNPPQQQQSPVQQPPPQYQQPPQGGAPWNGQPQQNAAPQQQYQQPPQQQYQPQAQPPANPGVTFQPAAQQQQPPAGWPQQ